jgi:ectoine hydroxylase-related dioxygenase (phytanoyl-CoA dioxygenase family)
MLLSKNKLSEFGSEGYLVQKNLLDNNDIDKLRKIIYLVYKKLNPHDSELERLDQPWNQLAFDHVLLQFRKDDPVKFGVLYDTCQQSMPFLNLVMNPKILECAASILNDEPENLSFSGNLLRMDAPQDTRNTLSWHQDRSYFFQNADGNHGLVVAVALQDTATELGALTVCPGSHKEGFLKPDLFNEDNRNLSVQRPIPSDVLNRYSEINMEMKQGDVLFIHMHLFHASGFNSSDQFRFTAIGRYHLFLKDDFVPYRMVAVGNPKEANRLGVDLIKAI